MLDGAFMNCHFPTCDEPADHRHHVTYQPEVIFPLCRKHHEDITILNGQQARKYRRKLSNKQRWFIWYRFLAGEMKPRRTKKAMEYIKPWDDFEKARKQAQHPIP
jgi:arylamine N-acetyltransferase